MIKLYSECNRIAYKKQQVIFVPKYISICIVCRKIGDDLEKCFFCDTWFCQGKHQSEFNFLKSWKYYNIYLNEIKINYNCKSEYITKRACTSCLKKKKCIRDKIHKSINQNIILCQCIKQECNINYEILNIQKY